GGGLYGQGADSADTVATPLGTGVLDPTVDQTGGGGGGGGIFGDGGDGYRGGGGGGGLEGDGADGGYTYTRREGFFNSTTFGNLGGGGGGGGEGVNDDAAPVPSNSNGTPGGAAPFSGQGGDGSNGIATGGASPGGCVNSTVSGSGSNGQNGTSNQGAGGGGAGSNSRTTTNTTLPFCQFFPLVLTGPHNGGDGGDGDVHSGGGGGGAGSNAEDLGSTPTNFVSTIGGQAGNGGDGGLGAGGGGGGRGDDAKNPPITTADTAGGKGGDGGNGGYGAGGGGAGSTDTTISTQGTGGTGGDFGGGGGASYGNAGNGGYGGGGGGVAGSDNGANTGSATSAGNGGFGGGGGGAGSTIIGTLNTSPNPTTAAYLDGTAGTAGFGAGEGGEADETRTLPTGEAGGSAGGGGGLGAGGAVFVRQGGQLNLTYTDNSGYLTNDVTGGSGGSGAGPGAGTGGSGQARGQAYFLDDNRALLNVADGFTVRYDDTIDDAREIGRAGGLDKFGCGTMQYGVDGNAALVMPYGDATDVYEGAFNVQNNARILYSTTNIAQSGGTQNNNCAESPLLSGTGTMADTNILTGGRHNAGNNPGDIASMTVQGDYTIGDGGTLEVDAGPGSASDTIVVRDRPANDPLYTTHLPGTTNATTSDTQVVITSTAILEVFFQPGTYNTGDEWLIIDNEGTTDLVEDETMTAILDTDTTGGFGTVIHNLGFNSVTVETNGISRFGDGNNVVLRFQGPLCDLTFNQNSTLGGSVTLDSTGDVVQNFDNLPDELKCPTLDTMSGEAHVSAAGMLLERSMALTGSIATRVAASWMQDGPAISGVRASQWLATWKRPEEVAAALEREEAGLEKLPRSIDMTENPEQYPDGWGAPLEEPKKTTVWGRMLGDFRFVSGDGNAADAFRHGAGMMVGADTKTSENTRMGIAVGIGRDWINVSERRGSSITVDSISASLYGSYTKEAWQAMLVGSVAHQMWDTERHILFPDNSIDRTARAEYDAFYWALRGELGYMHLADNGWLIRPSATARWAELHTDGFRETGAGDINLQNNGEVYRSIQTSLGLRASREKQLDNGWMRTFQIKGEWLHQWSDHYQEATFVFEGGGTPTAPTTQTPFQIRSPEESPASAILGLGVSFTNDTGVTGFVTGDAILSPTTFHPSLAAGLKLRF
ncbi:MAG: autotransporter outer membrane beta-barrel domain-containing protein, partial [Hyphomicrobiales bacterium]